MLGYVWLVAFAALEGPRLWGRLTRTEAPVRPLSIAARAMSRVWVEFRADEEHIYSGWLDAGEQVVVEAMGEAYLWCGQADRLAISVNGESAGTLAQFSGTAPRSPGSHTFRNLLPGS